ncbi:MAG: radical SAM protein [Gemmatimonadales bacterium]
MPLSPLAVLGEAKSAAAPRDEYVPHVVAWNLTRRCNLECAHCYIAAGPKSDAADELSTDECHRIMDEILALNQSPMFILSGGEPLLRQDLENIAAHASARGATVVVGTNGALLTDDRIGQLRAAGVSGVAVSVESLDPTYHDRFRRGHGSLDATLDAVARMSAHRLDFVVQTTITKGNRDELRRLVEWAVDAGAVSFNAYFLVTTGRGTGMSDLSPAEYEVALEELVDLHTEFLGRMMVRAKCAPHFMRLVHQKAPTSPILNYRTRCPCGVQYCRITPDGKLTACPYLPLPAGDLREQAFGDVWGSAQLFRDLRKGDVGGKCGMCEYRLLCGGCRARAYAREGDYLGADGSCEYDPPGSIPIIEPPRSVTYGSDQTPQLSWTPAAEARMQRIPSFVRGVVVKRVEDYARSVGCDAVSVELLRDVRAALPVDFSKRMPFFSRDDD